MAEILAIKGGSPVTRSRWPLWPRPQRQAEKLVSATLNSGRWTLSGPWQGSRTYEQQFAERFAAYNETALCVPTANGTSALVIGLESLGVGASDEVIIPGLTWVASASSVLNVNAVPVLVDIDPRTLCLDPAAVAAAITPRTRAIVVVHLYNSMADIDRILEIGRRYDLPVLEDCAQAHGARWNGRRAGTFGRIGTFSMQQTKLLTAGEGGAAITADPELFDRMFQLRADGRRLADDSPAEGEMELVERSAVMGNNYCMSEFSAAVLLDQIEVLDAEHRVRADNAERLSRALAEVPGLDPVRALPQVTGPTYYHYAVRCDRGQFADRPIARICEALQAEIGFPVTQCYASLNRNVLYKPQTKRRYHLSDDHLRRIDPEQYKLPEAERAHDEVLTLHHPALLAEPEMVDLVAEAFAKVQGLADQIPH